MACRSKPTPSKILRERVGGESKIALARSQLAGQRIREPSKGNTLGDVSIKELIEEGRE